MTAKTAKTDLKDVSDFIHRKKYWFSPKSAEEAEKFIIDGVLSLTTQNFYDRDWQWEMMADIGL